MTTPADHHPDHSAVSKVDRRADDAAGDHGADPSGALHGRDEGFDLARLGEITDRDGFAVFDPTAPGGVRALTPDEQHALTDSIRSDQRELGAGSDGADTGLHSESPYRPDAEWGDPDYREPASDAEAAARTAYVREHFPATGWTPRANTELEDALDDASERAVLSDRAHDPDPQAWAEYRRLLALDQLAPLPTDRDALDDPPHGERGQGDYSDDAAQLRTTGTTRIASCAITSPTKPPRAAAAGTTGPSPTPKAAGGPRPARGQRARATRPRPPTPPTPTTPSGCDAASRTSAPSSRPETTHPADIEGEQRREQLARWHDDDHAAHPRRPRRPRRDTR